MSGDWSFSGFGPRFDDHVQAHLPHYDLATSVAAFVASFVLPPGGQLVDLGCSTGTSIAAVAAAVPQRRFTAHGYDVDESMLARARQRLSEHGNVHASLLVRDLAKPDALAHDEADVTLALWTLQFLAPASWVDLLADCRGRTNRDGAIIVAAKTRHVDSRWQQIADGALVDWKAEHDVRPDEIVDKARSLRGVMATPTTRRLADDLGAAGWSNPTTLFRWHTWIVVGAWAD